MAKQLSTPGPGRSISTPGAAGKTAMKHAAKKSAKKAAKKAAKHAAKHVAKKAANHAGPSKGKDALRAFGHLGRLAALRGLDGDKKLAALARTLIDLAEQADGPENAATMAELLRAAEHVAFAGALLDVQNPMPLHPALEEQIAAAFESMHNRAGDQAPEDEGAARVQAELLILSEVAFEAGKYTQALELARAAEVLASVEAAV